MPELTPKPVKVVIIESERGWGQKIDEVKYFDTKLAAEAFVDDFNKDMLTDGTVPDWYMMAYIETY